MSRSYLSGSNLNSRLNSPQGSVLGNPCDDDEMFNVTHMQTFDTDKLHVPISKMFESLQKKERKRLTFPIYHESPISNLFSHRDQVAHERPFTTLFSNRDQISMASTAISSPKA